MHAKPLLGGLDAICNIIMYDIILIIIWHEFEFIQEFSARQFKYRWLYRVSSSEKSEVEKHGPVYTNCFSFFFSSSSFLIFI